MKRFVIGDIHGNYKALLQCLTRSGFDFENDQLITLGDIADGYSYVYECVELLLSIKNRIDIKGNHCDWFYQWLQGAGHPNDWRQGGEGTLKSYTSKLGFGYSMQFSGGGKTGMHPSDIPETHRKFFGGQKLYHIDEDRNLFVHGGFNRHYPLVQTVPYIFYWDRDLFSAAIAAKNTKHPLKFKDEFKNIFIGHTQTTHWNTTEPIFADIVINIDTGGGWNNGKVTIMNVDTKEYFQSDLSIELYPNEQIKRG